MGAALMETAHPAGRDLALYQAVLEVKAGHWRTMDQVLAETRTWSQWTTRTQVLATQAAKNNVVSLWLKEKPNVAAGVMHARVLTEQALKAHREGSPETPEQARILEELVDRAREACRRADAAHPYDPVVPICLLALAETDRTGRFPEYHEAPPELEFDLPHGPWGLRKEAHRRDELCREAGHRMSRVLQAGPIPPHTTTKAVRLDFAHWATYTVPRGSPLYLLPLYAHVEDYREQRDRGRSMPSQWWSSDTVRPVVRRAFELWFSHCNLKTSSLTDLNYLAFALAAGDFDEEAGAVFRIIGDYATPDPWRHVARHPDRWLEDFEKKRRACLKRRRPPSPGGYRP
ncbi:hypothetical protein ACFU99_11590 [Streptomyces sp. NPDC057654]|uniref:hypothetical protein n=1 Tax=Streptomyces sp. NPDC057654 TaxID=3346196 RepID=UPI0036A9AAC0